MRLIQSPKRYCILCVDDDRTGLELRTNVLQAEGYSVTAVSCPLLALKCEVSSFHLAVVDYDMPMLNGFELLLRLRAAGASFPIVLLSAASRDLPNDVRAVFARCLDKGTPLHELLNTIRAYLTSPPDPPECREVHGASSLFRRHGY